MRNPMERSVTFMQWILVLLLAAFAWKLAYACQGVREDLSRPHAALVDEAAKILLVETADQQPTADVPGARSPVIYSLRILEVLKGDASDTLEVPGDGDLSGIWDTTFSDHFQEEFWKHRTGRMGIRGSCDMVAPAFVAGARYLVFFGLRPDTKQFERVNSESDRWLTYVRRKLAGAKK